MADLVQEVLTRIPMPVDALEVTALIESLGITDELARRRYGATHAFDLAEQVLAALRGFPLSRPDGPRTAGARKWFSTDFVLDYAQGLLAFIPALLLLVVIRVYGALGGWEPGQVLALGLGMTTSMLVCGGFVYAMSRRTSICLAIDDRVAAGHFLRKTMLVAALCVAAIIGLIMLVTNVMDAFTLERRLTFACAFAGLSAIWILASGLSLMRASGWLSVALSIGLGAGVGVDRAVAGFSDLHLLAGTAVGFGMTFGTLAWALNRSLAGRGSHVGARHLVLPPRAYLIYEAVPYFIYGWLYATLSFLPHPIGWLGALAGGEDRAWAVINLEAGLTISLPPLILANGVIERTLRQFWIQALASQTETPGHARGRFGSGLRAFYYWHLRRYLVVLGVLSALMFGVFRLAQAAGLLATWLGYERLELVQNLFLISLVSYWVLGWGQFNCMLPMSLARPRLAIQAAAPAVGVTLLVGLPLAQGLHFTYAVAALLIGAVTFVIASSRAMRHVLESADYYYYSAY